jgi:signal transduction histidine kinase
MADVLLGDNGEPLSQAELQGFVKDIHQQSRYLSELINDILCVAELDAGPLKLQPVEVDMAKFLREALQRGHKLAGPKGIRLVLGAEPVGKMRGDLLRLRLVIDHLLANAIRYSPPGGQVHVSAEPAGNGWRIIVQDQGEAISEKDRPLLFQDFSRLSARPTAGEKSSGLGLAIARRVVEAHAGKIGADNLSGQGRIFWFEMP